jgi:hypothetical protein
MLMLLLVVALLLLLPESWLHEQLGLPCPSRADAAVVTSSSRHAPSCVICRHAYGTAAAAGAATAARG